MKYICPVCGFSALDKPAYNKGTPSFEICPCCFFQYGYTDDDQGFTFEQWRQKWIDEGMTWRRGKGTPPTGWDPKKQLLNIGIKI